MTIWIFGGVSVVAAMLALTLRQSQPALATVLTLLTGVLMLSTAIAAAVPLVDRVKAMLESTMIDSVYTSVLLKALGISLLTQTAADVCRDAGETALAAKAEFGGQVLLLMCALPLFEYAASMLESLIRSQAVIG